MPAESDEWARTAQRAVRGVMRWFVRLVVLPLTVLLVAFFWWQISNRAAIKRLEARIVAAGEPLNRADLQAIHEAGGVVSSEENVAEALLDLWEPQDPAFWKAYRSRTSPLPKRNPVIVSRAVPFLGAALSRSESRRLPWRETNSVAAIELLNRKQDYLTILRQALTLPRSRFPIQFVDGQDTLFTHLQPLRSEATLLTLSAHAHLVNGSLNEALEDLALVFRLAELLDGEPLLISHFVKVGSYRLALETIASICNYADLDVALIDRLDALVAGIRFERQDLGRALTWERANTLPLFDPASRDFLQRAHLLEIDPSWGNRLGMGIALTCYKLSGLPKADQRFLLESYEQAVGVTDSDWPKMVREMHELTAQIKTAGKSRFPPTVFSDAYVSSFDQHCDAHARFEALRRVTLLGLQLERHRLKHGNELADDLAAMIPEAGSGEFADPFDGQPMRFIRSAEGYVIYSVGPDLKDDQGRERGRPVESYDIPFRVEWTGNR
jgi:hypothetical protein